MSARLPIRDAHRRSMFIPRPYGGWTPTRPARDPHSRVGLAIAFALLDVALTGLGLMAFGSILVVMFTG